VLLKLTKISPVLAFFRQDGATTGHWAKKMQLVHMVHAVVVTCNMFKTCPDLWWLLLQFFPSLKRPRPSCPLWLKLRISTAGKSGHNMALNVPHPPDHTYYTSPWAPQSTPHTKSLSIGSAMLQDWSQTNTQTDKELYNGNHRPHLMLHIAMRANSYIYKHK